MVHKLPDIRKFNTQITMKIMKMQEFSDKQKAVFIPDLNSKIILNQALKISTHTLLMVKQAII
jgi:hypothetical protein